MTGKKYPSRIFEISLDTERLTYILIKPLFRLSARIRTVGSKIKQALFYSFFILMPFITLYSLIILIIIGNIDGIGILAFVILFISCVLNAVIWLPYFMNNDDNMKDIKPVYEFIWRILKLPITISRQLHTRLKSYLERLSELMDRYERRAYCVNCGQLWYQDRDYMYRQACSTCRGRQHKCTNCHKVYYTDDTHSNYFICTPCARIKKPSGTATGTQYMIIHTSSTSDGTTATPNYYTRRRSDTTGW